MHLHAGAKFCHQCGADNSRKRSLKEEPVQAKRAPQQLPGLSFEAFREAKGKERASGFKPKKTKLGKSQLQAEVNVQVGVMQLKDGFLRIVRGSCLPLKLLNSPFDVIVENTPPKPSSSNLEPTASTPGCSNDEIQDGPGALETTLLHAAQIEDAPQAITIQNFDEGAAILDVHSISLDTSEFDIKAVKIHQSTLRQDMLELFSNDDVLKCNLDVAFIGHNGQEEIGRGQGVLREALTSFWKGFCNALSVGTQSKVPAIRHDYQRKEWEAVARILIFGYMKEQYFPLLLSPAIIAACLFGEEHVSDDYLLRSFNSYVAEEERDALKKCISDDFESADEDVLDFLSSYKCYKHVTKQNITEVVHQLAHQELIQRPKYITNCWCPYLKILLQYGDFKSVESLEKLYVQRKPTSKNITVSFIDLQSDPVQSGKGRRPIVRRCGPVLELPSTYLSYNKLSEEFTELLNNKDSWE
eukprot:gene12616-13905_t